MQFPLAFDVRARLWYNADINTAKSFTTEKITCLSFEKTEG